MAESLPSSREVGNRVQESGTRPDPIDGGVTEVGEVQMRCEETEHLISKGVVHGGPSLRQGPCCYWRHSAQEPDTRVLAMKASWSAWVVRTAEPKSA